MSEEVIKVQPFSQIELADPFFDSLRADYEGFDNWYQAKASDDKNKAYVIRYDDGAVLGFLYLKIEEGPVEDVTPNLPAAKRLKIGTFKIDGHGTKLGERFLKKIFDQALAQKVDQIYVTIFEKHAPLVGLFKKHNFQQVATKNGELVLLRDLKTFAGDLEKDYPYFHTQGRSKYLLAVHPQWHSELFPDSLLNNETYNVVRDVSQTNSIHKVYVCEMEVDVLKPGDLIMIYRTKDPKETAPAEYRAVATSICVAEDVRRASSFAAFEDFKRYCEPFSVFPEEVLAKYYAKGPRTRVIKMTYNAAMSKKLTRRALADEAGLNRNERWSFLPLTNEQFSTILKLGGVNEDLIID